MYIRVGKTLLFLLFISVGPKGNEIGRFIMKSGLSITIKSKCEHCCI